MPKIYRLKHLPTGLYFCPSREIQVKLLGDDRHHRYVKSNLSKTGKTYLKKPTLAYIGGGYYTHLINHANELTRNGNVVRPFVSEEWIIEEVE